MITKNHTTNSKKFFYSRIKIQKKKRLKLKTQNFFFQLTGNESIEQKMSQQKKRSVVFFQNYFRKTDYVLRGP